MFKIIRSYWRIDKVVRSILMAEFFIQVINSAFLMILNIHLTKEGYSDSQIANFVSYRYISVIIIAFPLGLYIKGRKLKPLFYLATIGISLSSLAILYAISIKSNSLINISLTAWGTSFTFMQVVVLPYILRNCKPHKRSEAISLSYATYSLGMIFSGFFIYFLSTLNKQIFDEETILYIISIISLLGVYYVYRAKHPEQIPELDTKRINLQNFDWLLIAKALIPSLILAVGAGLTIPFINLFFYNVFNMDSGGFSFMNAISSITVAIAALLVPVIKKKYGYHVAVTVVQTIAVISLALMAISGLLNSYSWAIYLAILFFLIRQPLMNMASPVVSELVLVYVGKRNQEIVSALTAAVWSGSWFLSALLFREMRSHEINYSYIFLITATLYSMGVLWYYNLINEMKKRGDIT